MVNRCSDGVEHVAAILYYELAPKGLRKAQSLNMANAPLASGSWEYNWPCDNQIKNELNCGGNISLYVFDLSFSFFSSSLLFYFIFSLSQDKCQSVFHYEHSNWRNVFVLSLCLLYCHLTLFLPYTFYDVCMCASAYACTRAG